MEIENLYLQVLSEPIPEQTFLKIVEGATRRSTEDVSSQGLGINRRVHKEGAEHAKIYNPACGTICDLGDPPAGGLRSSRLIIPTFETPFMDERGINPTYAGPKSFRFDRLETNPGALNDLCDSLKNYGFIDKRNSVRDFKKIFSGKEIENPIRWTGNASELYWFIYQIYTKYKFVEDLKQQQWKVACECFVQADGSRFNANKLRNMKRPRLTGALQEKAVGLLR